MLLRGRWFDQNQPGHTRLEQQTLLVAGDNHDPFAQPVDTSDLFTRQSATQSVNPWTDRDRAFGTRRSFSCDNCGTYDWQDATSHRFDFGQFRHEWLQNGI